MTEVTDLPTNYSLDNICVKTTFTNSCPLRDGLRRQVQLAPVNNDAAKICKRDGIVLEWSEVWSLEHGWRRIEGDDAYGVSDD